LERILISENSYLDLLTIFLSKRFKKHGMNRESWGKLFKVNNGGREK
jgi:hypothetical protein